MSQLRARKESRERSSDSLLGETSAQSVDVRAPIEVTSYESKFEAEVLRVLDAAFGTWPAPWLDSRYKREFFHWKMTECPFGPSLSGVALKQGRVVGFLGQLLWRLRVFGQPVLSSRGMDLAVDPDHRRQGISTALIRWAMDNNPREIALAWNNPNDQSRPGLMKTGRRKGVVLPSFVQCRPSLAPARRRLTGAAFTAFDGLHVEAGTAVEVLGDANYVVEVLSESPQRPDRLETERDLDYLRWRFGRFGGYCALRSDQGGAPGIVIFKLRRWRSLCLAEIMELLVAGGDAATKRRLIAKVRRSAAVDMIRARFDTDLEALRCGFVRCNAGTALTVRQSGHVGLDATTRSAWRLSLGDVDLL